jgi:hypothetical protein
VISVNPSPADLRVIAIDWSGQKKSPRKKIWLAEVTGGQMVRAECGRNREEIVDHLIAMGDEETNLVIGLDFAFSFPLPFCTEGGFTDHADIWRNVAEHGEDWLSTCCHPFWGRPGKKRPQHEYHFRKTEDLVSSELSTKAKSVFQIGGGGAVGTGSIRGMPHLLRLLDRGFNIWPFTSAEPPLVLEIYPRTLTGPVTKSKAEHRTRYFQQHPFPEIDTDSLARATSCEDAFDAAVSAVSMFRHLDQILALPQETDPHYLLEGKIWTPDDDSQPAA